MTGYEKRVGGAVGVFFEELAQAAGYWGDHFAGDGEEAGVAEVGRVVLFQLEFGMRK